MKFRINVLTLMLGLLGGLFACTSEEMIDAPDSNGQLCDMSLILSMNDIQSKATVANNYTYATTDEITINKCHVAVFELDDKEVPTNRIHFQDFSNMGSLTDNLIGSLSGYKLELNNVRTFGKGSKKVKVLIVANADNSNFTTWTTYNQYVAGTLTTSSFNAAELIKVGISNVVTLTYGTTNSATEIPITLNQLSAKIIYEGVYDDKGVLDQSFSLTKVSGINTQSQVAIFDTDKVENNSYTPGNVNNATTFCTYETSATNKNIVLSVKKKSEKNAQDHPFAANKFVKGNLYKIKGSYTPSISFDIKWVVTDMGKANVNIPDFK